MTTIKESYYVGVYTELIPENIGKCHEFSRQYSCTHWRFISEGLEFTFPSEGNARGFIKDIRSLTQKLELTRDSLESLPV